MLGAEHIDPPESKFRLALTPDHFQHRHVVGWRSIRKEQQINNSRPILTILKAEDGCCPHHRYGIRLTISILRLGSRRNTSPNMNLKS
jgi:hypothetical protein